MSPFRVALKSLRFHWRTNFAVALGVMAATAVLTGALVVGDSVRGSLRELVIDRLGRIDAVLSTPRFFREKLADELAAAPSFQQNFATALPAIMLQGTLENTAARPLHRVGKVSLLGVGPQFWQLGRSGPQQPPQRDEMVLNQPLAEQLHAEVGDEIILRLPQASDVPADSPLGRKTETSRSRRFKVSAIIAAEGLGRFGVRPTQQLPLDAFTAIEPLQRLVDVHDRVNAILVAGRNQTVPPNADAEQALGQAFQPTLADYGLALQKTDRSYYNLTTDRMLLEPAVVDAAMKAFTADGAQPALTYLANYILVGDGRGKIPYSTVAAVDFAAQPPLGPFVNRQGVAIGPIAEGEIVLNAWAADDLAAQGATVNPGDPIEITYFEPESTHGQVTETHHTFRLKDIAAMSGAAVDRNFTPEVKGVTDEVSIADWNPPFPYDPSRVRSVPPNNQDDAYWRQYKATPKAFIGLADGRKLWGSRFGQTTSVRIPAASDVSENSLAKQLLSQLNPGAMGFNFLPVKRIGLEAAAGTTPFALLFLGFSMFIIVAALMLVMLLFKLGIDQRAAELGIMLGIGFRRRLARRVLLIEGFCVAAVGAAAGAVLGVGYAWLMIEGLKTWWLAAISTPFLNLYVAPADIAIGYACGVLVSLITIAWALRQLRHVSVRQLLAGQAEASRYYGHRRRHIARWIAGGLFILAVPQILWALWLKGEAQAGAFFGTGALVLAALLIFTWDVLRSEPRSSFIGGRAALARLAWRSGTRHPLRSTLTIGLTASACFLIVALSAFQLNTPKGAVMRSGDGGFALIAESDQPIYQNLATAEGRSQLGFGAQAEQTVAAAQRDGCRIFSLRVHDGDDASCLNLYQPRMPRVVGIPHKMMDRGGFLWAGSLAQTEGERYSPWYLLERNGADSAADSKNAVVPVVLDQNTAEYSLHLTGGVGEIFQLDRPGGGRLTLQVVGLLKTSIFQGDLLVSEDEFLRMFPDQSGYRLFLIEAPPEDVTRLAADLDNALGDYGFNVQTTASRLAGFFAVQNTYLATFRTLGGLGLLLGTLGLATVQLRSMIERRGELALLRAIGFRRRRLAKIVLLENASLLIVGLAAGIIAALVALLPHLFDGAAEIPWLSLGVTLGAVLIVGLLAGSMAVGSVLKAPLLPALRGE